MTKRLKSSAGRASILLLAWLGICVLFTLIPSNAATPDHGTIDTATKTFSYTFAAQPVANGSAAQGGAYTCNATTFPCDLFQLTVDLPPGYVAAHPQDRVSVAAAVTSSQTDIDLQLKDIQTGGTTVHRDNPPTQPTIIFQPADGVNHYEVQVVPGTPNEGGNVVITLYTQIGGAVTQDLNPPRYDTYPSPQGIGDDWGEPSVGVNWQSEQIFSNSAGPIPNGGTIMSYGGFGTVAERVTFDDCPSPALALFEATADLVTAGSPRAAGDPILFTDHDTGRTFVCQLEGGTPSATTEITDDDGVTYQPSQGSGIAAGVDHQTIGGGIFPPGGVLQPTGSYENAVYYCSQDIADASCAVSLDGGLTFGPATVMYTAADCGGLHGHIKVSPVDGTIYVPNAQCGAEQGVAVSEDAGTTWTVRHVTGSTAGDRDPSLGIATDGTVYFGYMAGDHHARIAVSHDKGRNWIRDVDVGAFVGVQSMVFAEVAAGDPDRAVFAFFGTSTAGDYANASPTVTWQNAVWYLYIATTFDGGASWGIVNATPGDPIQRGPICAGTLDSCRNLLDFMDVAIDKEGRVVVGYEDGCLGPCAGPGGTWNQSQSSKSAIARQAGGRRMFAADDPVEPAVAKAPRVVSAIRQDTGAVEVTWMRPDNSGSPITGYNLYRSLTSGTETLFASNLPASPTKYTDNTADPALNYYYRVTAINAIGEGPYCREVNISGIIDNGDPCSLPGVRIALDGSADSTTNPTPGQELLALYGAELYTPAPAPDKLYFTMLVDSLNPAPANTVYYTYFTLGATKYFLSYDTSAPPGFSPFDYGWVDTSQTPNQLTACTSGSGLDAESLTTPTGTIQLVISKSKINACAASRSDPKNLANTPTLSNVYAEIRALIGAVGTGLVTTVDGTAPSSYTQVGNLFCRPNTAPTITTWSVTPTSGDAPLSVSFTAAATDPDTDLPADTIANYHIDFGDDPTCADCYDSSTAPTNFNHVYTASGESANYSARLTVTDSRGKKALSVPVPITVLNRVRPQLTATPADIGKGSQVTLDASQSTGPSGQALTFSFNPGDGSGAGPYGSATTTDHTYLHVPSPDHTTDSVVYSAAVSVQSQDGDVRVATAPVTVHNAKPTGTLSVSPGAQGNAPFIVQFDTSGSSDPDLTDLVASYDIDFGDGTAQVSGEDAVLYPGISHRYQQPGLYNALLRVYDNDGLRSGADYLLQINVPNRDPVAALTVTPAATNKNHLVTFDASASNDPDQGPLSYRFDFGDGTQATGSTSSVTHSYSSGGTYTVTLTVTDFNDAAASVSDVVSVTNSIPVAVLTADSTDIQPYGAVNFSAAGSHDPDTPGDSVQRYTFDFGDGSAPVSGAAPSASHTYSAPAAYVATLTVFDKEGAASDPVVLPITVSSGDDTRLFGGGAFAPWTLLLLGLLRMARRSRSIS